MLINGSLLPDMKLENMKLIIDVFPPNDLGCLLYKEGRYEEALVKFNGAQQVVGYDPHLSYNIALCHYR